MTPLTLAAARIALDNRMSSLDRQLALQDLGAVAGEDYARKLTADADVLVALTRPVAA